MAVPTVIYDIAAGGVLDAHLTTISGFLGNPVNLTALIASLQSIDGKLIVVDSNGDPHTLPELLLAFINTVNMQIPP